MLQAANAAEHIRFPRTARIVRGPASGTEMSTLPASTQAEIHRVGATAHYVAALAGLSWRGLLHGAELEAGERRAQADAQ